MGLFDIFKSKKPSSAPPAAEPKGDKNVARLGRVAADKHAQNYDRMEAIEALSKIQSPEVAAVLLKRFTFYIEPSITDQEEKELAFHSICACGEDAVEPVLDFCEKAESLTWPLKVLRELLTPEGFVDEVVDLLEGFDTDYARNNDPKLQLLGALENQRGEKVRSAVERFLEDVNEPVRFQAVATLLSLGDPAVAGPLAGLAVDEESVRIRNKIAEGLSLNAFPVPDSVRSEFSDVVSRSGYIVDGAGKVRQNR